MTRQQAIPQLSRWVTVNVPGIGPAKVTHTWKDGREVVVVRPAKNKE